MGASMYSGTYFAAYAPAGIGFQFNLGEGTFVHLQGTYKAAVTALAVNYMSYSIGIASPITERKQAALVTPPPPPVADKDTDGDGIPDSKDKCRFKRSILFCSSRVGGLSDSSTLLFRACSSSISVLIFGIASILPLK